MYNCIIIDDQSRAIASLKKYIQTLPTLQVLASYRSPTKALSELNKSTSVDLVLMDIDMPDMSGIELAKAIRTKTKKLIFTTAHTKYAYDAYEADGDAYLLKPYSLLKFTTTINKLFPEVTEIPIQQHNNDYFFIKSKKNHNLINIRYSEIISIESKLNYIEIKTINSNILTHMTLNEAADYLNQSKGFLRFQRSYILSEAYIDYIDG